ncbi:inhibitor of nuclear factor kappa-B kinase subunit alpha isoform X3 [Salmo salar]|uniref:Inhibitor of nuclear factor kappa-B kinase subunit alpha n=1 Tax=Salmo salar TaxID=8030 RepID=A0ABM3DID9_SALSA|nr:inhibitor of nuclear factor kappa-B kinase subunit alpha isoform X3 [Salmo salar]
MEKVPVKQSQVCGLWELKEQLGTGGFGHVYLYQHLETSEKIAVKLCRLELNSKNRERWSREIQIMKKLSHDNVVRAREVPEEMSSIALNDLPLLAMEYCSRGDLRKLLNKPENCCGLKESQVLSLLSHVGSGIQYLHENKIIHRDLKPENIVLQEASGKFVHKIIDLGYAKDLDQGSLCTSFVGTLQYLAPELFENKPYTVSVDYWSFGTMIFECTCGFRPFLHNMQPVQWTSKVRNKGPKDIMAVEDMNGDVRFSTHLPYPNNLSRSLLEPVESLLQMLLLWDPVTRGGVTDRDTHTPCCYTTLQNILNMKVMHVLDMTSAQLHSFVLGSEEGLHSLQQRVETHTHTHIPPLSQELLLETGVSLDPRRPPAHCLPDGPRGWDSAIVYLFDKSLTKYSGPFTARPLPDSVNFIASEKLLKAWQDNEQKAAAFTQVSEVGYLDEEIVCLHSEIVELQRSPFARRQADIMEQLEEKAIELYKQLKAKCKSPDPPHGYSDSSEMVKTIVQTVQNQDRILRDLYTHLSKILECKCRIVALFPKLEGAVESIKAAEAAVMTMQMKRQREFWHLLKIACAQNGSHNSLTPSSNASSPPPLTMNPLGHTHSESVRHLLDENQRYLSQLTSLLQETSQDKTCNIMDQDWSWTQYGSVVDPTLETLDTHTH